MVETSDNLSWKVVQVSENLTDEDENASAFRLHLLNLFNSKNFKIRFDFSGIKNINTNTLNIFVIFSNLLKGKLSDYQVEIINANDDIVNLFKMTHLDRTYKIN